MGRVAIVTGGTRGIGKAIGIALKAAGHTVAATYHGNDEAAQAFTKETGVHSFKWDVANFEACQEGVAKVAADVGPVDMLVNNAGITRDATLMRMSHDDWQAVIDTNLGSCFNMSKAVFPGMRERQFGRIVNISSINGQKGQMGQVNYSAAKAGMIGFSKALAQEGARFGITVNSIAPGYTETDMVAAVPQKILDSIVAQIPVGRLGSVDDIARGVVFLCAEDAGWITGSTLTINGGHYLA